MVNLTIDSLPYGKRSSNSLPHGKRLFFLPVSLVDWPRHSVRRQRRLRYANFHRPDRGASGFAGAIGFTGRPLWALLAVALAVNAAPTAAASQKYQSDAWVTECEDGSG